MSLTANAGALPRSESWLTPLGAGAAAIAIGAAVQASNGNLDPAAIGWLSLALFLCGVAALAPAPIRLNRFGESAVAGVLLVGFAFQITELFTHSPAIYLRPSAGGFAPFFRGLAVVAVIGGACLAGTGWKKHALLGVLLVAHFFLGRWLFQTSPSPFIDVFVFQRDSLDALIHGVNPYSISFPNIYGHSAFYGPGVIENGRLTIGYPYPPLSLLLALPAQLIAGDFRFSQLLAMEGAAVLMAYARPGRVGLLAAVVFLLTPRVFFVLEQSWTEPHVLLFFAATVFCACRWWKGFPYALGLLLAVKQYSVLCLPLTLLLFPRPWKLREILKTWLRAIAVAAVITIPFMLLAPSGFFRSVLVFQMLQPFRVEALSYLAWLAKDGQPPVSPAIAFLLAPLVLGLCLWRAPRTPAGFAAATALTFAVFFAFNKQAFCNYYYLVLGLMSVAAAAGSPDSDSAPQQSLPQPPFSSSGVESAPSLPVSPSA